MKKRPPDRSDGLASFSALASGYFRILETTPEPTGFMLPSSSAWMMGLSNMVELGRLPLL